jgi:hypothetical protein
LGDDSGNWGANFKTDRDHVSWTFRKAPEFFDVVTYTGDGVAGREIPHNLGVEPGMVIVKKTNAPSDWPVWHRDLGEANSGSTHSLTLNDSNQQSGRAEFATTQTATHIVIGSIPGGINANGDEYVAYLFAHDDSDEGLIQCGSYTGNGVDANSTNEINLGWEPQWVMVKNASGSGGWYMQDTMRGLGNGLSTHYWLQANESADEKGPGQNMYVTPTGFLMRQDSGGFNANGQEYIYMAIRRPNKPASEFEADELFAIDTSNSTGNAPPQWFSGFPVDMGLNVSMGEVEAYRYRQTRSRLAPGLLKTNTTDAEAGSNPDWFAYNDGWANNNIADIQNVAWMWRRAPGFFDVVAWDGPFRGIPHNLGVVPEIEITKPRNMSGDWSVLYSKDPANMIRGKLNSGDSFVNTTEVPPTDTEFTPFYYGNEYVTYLFASVPGICDIGSYTGTGGNDLVDIDCGFTNGARFVLIKAVSDTGDWMYFDTIRGISNVSSPFLKLNTTDAQVSGSHIGPYSKGFTTYAGANLVANKGVEYIYMAIA